jgi:anti-sigma B factor antagonist
MFRQECRFNVIRTSIRAGFHAAASGTHVDSLVTTEAARETMTIEERAIGSVVVLDMSGRLVLGEGDQLLKERVSSHLEQGNRQVVLNVGNVSYVDSSGLGVIVSSFLAARNQGGALRLVNPSSRLHQLLAMAKLLTVVAVCQPEEEAVGSLMGG